MEISKELLSEVLDFNNEQKRCYKEYKLIGRNEISIYFFDADSTGKTGTHWWKKINIYELSHKCKEWAFEKGYEIVVFAYMIRIYRNGYEVYYTNTTLFDLDMFFKACEWVRKEINK